jgi:adenylate kinase family enzyme
VERDDDSEGVVARRLATYERETLPVLNYYRSGGGGGYRRVDGNRSAAEIADEVLEIVGAFDVTAVAA